MRDILLIGLNHKTAPVALRECAAFSADESHDAVQSLHSHPDIDEVVLLSTCNRVEVLVTTDHQQSAGAAIKHFLTTAKGIPSEQVEDITYTHVGDDAVRHIFRVAASLDSMVVGEPQILGQVKAAYLLATRQRTSGVVLNRLMHRTFFVAKRIRTETGIGDHAVSISYAAIELARKIFGELDGKQALLIGAGEMAELAVEHLIRHRVAGLTVANRTFARAVALADKHRGIPIRFEEIGDALPSMDIVISSTGSPDYVVTRKDVKASMRSRRNRPVFFIDIAVPRDIDPDINRLNNAYVYDIDDLNDIVDDNKEDRQREAIKGERIIDEAVIKFRTWLGGLDVVPTIKELRQHIADIVTGEVARTIQGLGLDDAQRQSVERMIPSLVNKILHNPTTMLKGEGCHGDQSVVLDMTRKLFKLDG
ncbi:MAG: glutamyl-tRNA reductase [Pseudomonadota bacterium]